MHDQLDVVIPDHVLDDLRVLAAIDPDAQGFRYSHTGEGHRQFLPGEYWVSLRDLSGLWKSCSATWNRCSGDSRGSSLTAGRGRRAHTLGVITGAIKWGDANFAFVQLRRLRGHTLWPPP